MASATHMPITLNDRFSILKANLEPNETFAKRIQQRHNAVRSLVQTRNPKVIDTKLIGSVGRKTRIQPRPEDKFDIDILVVMGSFFSWLEPGDPNGVTPQRALGSLHHTLTTSDRYSPMSPQQAPPTIAMTYADDTTVEFVPAYKDQIGASPNGVSHYPAGRAYWVPKNAKWELSDYDYEADYISARNNVADGLLIPTIKMLKAIRREYFPSMKSFQLDILAAAIVPVVVSVRTQGGGTVTYPEIIRDFFNLAPQNFALSTQIPGSHSPAMTLVASDVSTWTDLFGKITRFIDSLNLMSQESKKAEGWKTLFGEPFPIS